MLLPAILRAADVVTILRRDAGRCALMWQRGDCEGIVAYLPPEVVARAGGRVVVWRDLKDQFAQARALGADRMQALVGRPSVPRQIASWMTAILPVTAILRGAHLEMTQQTRVLALSPDGGKRWYFLLLYQITPADLKAWFPELAGKIALVADPPPQMDVVF
ncbi:MAG TPA: hypothetical protein VGM64_02550 [Lacunisphaera sp.]|jgi:hypothetical protein